MMKHPEKAVLVDDDSECRGIATIESTKAMWYFLHVPLRTQSISYDMQVRDPTRYIVLWWRVWYS
jgi:hypothetical protein